MKRTWLFQNWWLLTVKGLVFIGFSGCAIAFPLSILWPNMGWLLLTAGLLQIVLALSNRLRIHTWSWLLTEGIFDLTVGLLAISQPHLSAAMFPFVLGIWMVFVGVVHMMTARTVAKLIEHWWILRLTGLYSILMGLLTLYRSSLDLSALMAVYALVIGSFYVLGSFLLRKVSRVWLESVLSEEV